MSLQYSELNNAHTSVSLMNQNFNNNVEEYYPKNPISMEELLSLCNKEFEEIKKQIGGDDKYIDSEEKLNKTDLNFLQNIISIKNKIIYKKKKYKKLYSESIELSKDIEQINDMINSYDHFLNLYTSILNKKGDNENEILNTILEKLNSKILEKKTLDYQITNILKDIGTLKNILKQDESNDEINDSEPNEIKEENSQNININLLCKICDESQIEYCLNPCGHSFCNICILHLNNNCFTCRSKVNGKIRMFF